jgi:hypothetical protein
MPLTVPPPQAVIADIELIEEIIAQGETFVATVGSFVEKLHALRAPAPAPVAEPVPAAPTAPTAWDTSAQAMENYDAEALVAMRKDLAAGLIDDAHGVVASILARRLGSSKP